MQPQEPPTGQAPPPANPPAVVQPPAGSPPQQAPRRSRARLWVAVGGGILALLCLGGAGVFLSLYDKATKIDRASPDSVTSSFLRAYLLDRDDKEASLFTCKQGASLGAIGSLRDQMVTREKTYGTTVTANWGALKVSDVPPKDKSVAADIAIVGSLNGQQVSSHTESWTFELIDDGGWRVCSASKVG